MNDDDMMALASILGVHRESLPPAPPLITVKKNTMFPDVAEARDMRKKIISGEIVNLWSRPLSCPICHKQVSNHNSTFTNEGGKYLHLPCWRRGEWDRYGLHIAPTMVQPEEL